MNDCILAKVTSVIGRDVRRHPPAAPWFTARARVVRQRSGTEARARVRLAPLFSRKPILVDLPRTHLIWNHVRELWYSYVSIGVQPVIDSRTGLGKRTSYNSLGHEYQITFPFYGKTKKVVIIKNNDSDFIACLFNFILIWSNDLDLMK